MNRRSFFGILCGAVAAMVGVKAAPRVDSFSPDGMLIFSGNSLYSYDEHGTLWKISTDPEFGINYWMRVPDGSVVETKASRRRNRRKKIRSLNTETGEWSVIRIG